MWGIFSFVIAMLISLICGIIIIKKLKEASFGQEIREEGPSWHKKKSGTPTMGGFIFFAGLVPAAVIILLLSQMADLTAIAVLLCAVFFGIIGFSDDYIKVIKKRNLGLTAKQKFLAQIMVSAAFSLAIYFLKGGEVLFFNKVCDWSYFIIPFNILVLLATNNAVNLTDGVDALAGSTTFFCMGYFAFAAYYMEMNAVGIVIAAVMGGVAGFLFYNRHPAKVFMGDTGSLFLGGLIGAVACALGLQFTVITAGIVFFIETLSVIMQVTYFKITHGKRIFLMTPIHHHFEKKGWSEVRIVVVASLITIIMGILSALYVKMCI
ncbi:MAG: phospho-N-acetylmuramoyl-pentapeptide-transferase [Clostridia bacterium]|nr:phospho-N-acetylmuramoyl-pentapeptide-transferase [Clostridia bacterium]